MSRAASEEQATKLHIQLLASAPPRPHRQQPLTDEQRHDLVALLAVDYRLRSAKLELTGSAPTLANERCVCCGRDLKGEMATKVRSFWFRSSHLRAAAAKAA